MLLKDDKKRMVTIILKRLKGSDDFDTMRSSNEEYSEAPISKDGAELDNTDALSTASEKAMEAIESKDAKSFKNAIKEMISLCMEEYSD